MAEGKEIKENIENIEREEVFSNAVRAGKRTYFFDVKATRRNDYYLTITESKKRYNKDGRFFYEKHKVFLYKEDFDKFIEGLTSSIDFIRENQNETLENNSYETENSKPVGFLEEPEDNSTKAYTDVEFEDLEVSVVAQQDADK